MRILVLLLLGYANLSLALGIGDITLKSHLGEPFVASINVTDVEKSPDTNCFSVKDNSDSPAFKKVFTTLKQTIDGYQLYISTLDAVTEPIVNLNVSFHCEPNLNRDYVLLLDPASLSNVENVDSSNNQVSPVNSQTLMPTVPSSNLNDPKPGINAQTSDTKPIKKKTRRSPSAESEIDKKLREAYTGKGTATIAPRSSQNKMAETPAGTGRAYLSISGGNVNSNANSNQPNLSLRLETQIDFARMEAPAPITESNVMDEVTVMANRLAHLEKQIVSLQTRNTQLVSEAERAKAEAKNAGLHLSEQQSEWLKNILIGFGVLIALAGGEWLRRRSIRSRLDRKEADWFNAEENPAGHHQPSGISASDFKNLDDDLMDEASFGQLSSSNLNSLNNTGALLLNENANDEHENILENADVFIEHGRPALAIQLLQNHLIDFPSESPKIWLRLLSLIAAEGSQAEYDRTVAECKQFFNIKMPSFAESGSEDYSSIEDFPHIITRLEGVWGSQYALDFLNDLIYNQQSQPREGFGRGTFEELFFLKQVAEILNAHTTKEQANFYQSTAVKPELDSHTFNKVAFDNSHVEDDNNVATEIKSQDNAPDNEEITLNAPLNQQSSHLESSAFQTVPSYDVDMLIDFDEALRIRNNISQEGLLNNELTPSSDEVAQTTIPETLETTLADEIDFNITEEPEVSQNDATKKSNLIDWDLPDKN